MKAVDTNVPLRFVLNDDDAQSPMASDLMRRGAYLSNGVLLEFVWVLASRYRLDRETISNTLADLIEMPSVTVSRQADIRWVIERYRAGADFADMIHLVDASTHEVLATFDADVAKDAGTDPPTVVETLLA